MNEQATGNSQNDSTGDNNLHILPAESPFTNLDAIVLSIEWEITDETMDTFLAEINRLKKSYKNDKVIYSLLQLHGTAGKYIRVKKVKAHPDSLRLLHSVHDGLVRILATPKITEADKRRILSGKIKQFKDLKHQIIESGKTVREKPTDIQIKPAPAPSPIEKIEKVVPKTEQKIDVEPPEPAVLEPLPESREIKPEKAPEDAAPTTPSEEAKAAPEKGASETHEEITPEILPETLALAVEELKQFIREELSHLKKELQLMKNGS